MGNSPNVDKLSYIIQFESEQNSDGEPKLNLDQIRNMGLELDSKKTVTALCLLAGKGNGIIDQKAIDNFSTYEAALTFYKDNINRNYGQSSIYAPTSMPLKWYITLAVRSDEEGISSDQVLEDILEILGTREILEPSDQVY